jgi:hypothetical protein
MAAVMQFVNRPRDYWEAYAGLSGDWRHHRVVGEAIWPKAIHRIAAEGISPEQAADEAIARIKQLLSE